MFLALSLAIVRDLPRFMFQREALRHSEAQGGHHVAAGGRLSTVLGGTSYGGPVDLRHLFGWLGGLQ